MFKINIKEVNYCPGKSSRLGALSPVHDRFLGFPTSDICEVLGSLRPFNSYIALGLEPWNGEYGT